MHPIPPANVKFKLFVYPIYDIAYKNKGGPPKKKQTPPVPLYPTYQYMSSMPPGGIAGIGFFFSGFSVIIASVVSINPATEAAF